MAANELDALEQKQISGEEAKARVLAYLHKARNAGFFNPHAVHVEATHMRKLIASTPGITEADRAQLLVDATANVDRTLILLEHQQSTPRSFQNLDYLEDARDRLLDLIPNHADFEAEASRLWNSVKSQDGFVLAARLLYRKASSRNKGSDYFAAHEYVVTAMSTVAAAGGLVSLPLHEIWLQIHYHWRVVRKTVVGVSGSINWNRLDQVVRRQTSPDHCGCVARETSRRCAAWCGVL